MALKARCDSFVVETNVHYPTDINLLLDAISKVINLVSSSCLNSGVKGWRQHRHWLRKVKRLYNNSRKLKRSTSKKPEKKAIREEKIKEAYQSYLLVVESLLERARNDIDIVIEKGVVKKKNIEEIQYFMSQAHILIDQIQRRVLQGEVILHEAKIFSLFEPHTEWISKGKAGVPQELGLKVCVVEDQYGFILHHRVMQKEQDVDIAVIMAKTAKQKFPSLSSCSFDKGFHSPDNRTNLSKVLDQVILPKKGKLSAQEREIEHSETFRVARHQHSAVESAINALENHGLDRCPDHGIDGFERYVALAVVASNLHKLGNILMKKKKKRLKKAA